MAKIKLVFFLFCILLNAQNKDIDIQHIAELQILGDSLFKVSNYTDAAKVYKELVQIDPNSFDFNFSSATNNNVFLGSNGLVIILNQRIYF